MKRVYVILAFHAHEPLWEFPARVQALADRDEIRRGKTAPNYIKKRADAGRDIYRDLIGMGRRMRAPLSLEASNELLAQIEHFMPETYAELKRALGDGTLHPVLGHAHHTHICLLTQAEIIDELRLNAEYLFERMGAPRPRILGAFPTEGSVDRHKLGAYREFGLEYLIFPHLEPAKFQYRVIPGDGSRDADITYHPYAIGPGLLALPRNFPISQYIWKPITRLQPEPLRYQGYLLGDYPVFPEEYRGEGRVSFPIDEETAIREYTAVLGEEIGKAPADGLLLYIQDLELMDFGEAALRIMEAAWSRVAAEAEIVFTTPQDYLDATGLLHRPRPAVPAVEFDQASWAPEIRPVLRTDGHYPPLGAGKVRGHDVLGDYLREWPFAFWEPGRYFTMLTNYLLDRAGLDLLLPVAAGDLAGAGYEPAALSPIMRLRLLGRLMKRACNWGWRPDEARQKRPLAALYLIAQEMAGIEAEPRGEHRLTDDDWQELARGLAELNRLFLGYRAEYLRHGLQQRGWLTDEQEARLAGVEKHHEAADGIAASLAALAGGGEPDLARLAATLKDYCRELFMGTELLQEIWAAAPETDALVTEMYHFLYDRVPPRFAAFLRKFYGSNRAEERVGLRGREVLSVKG